MADNNLTPNPFPSGKGNRNERIPFPNGKGDRKPTRALRSLAAGAIAIYRAAVSPVIHAMHGPACRFEPSCSVYARDAITEYGMVRGGIMAIWRIARCNPMGGHGFDPVRSSSLAPRGGEGLSGVRDDRAARLSVAPHTQNPGNLGPSPAAQSLASASPLVGRGNSGHPPATRNQVGF